MSLNQTVCTTPMCKDGRSKVARMVWTLTYLHENYPAFNDTRFSATVTSIQAQLNNVDSWYADFIPFNPVCCTINDLGNQADEITNQMLASVGSVAIPPPPKETDWVTLAVVVGGVLLLSVYSPQIKQAFKK